MQCSGAHAAQFFRRGEDVHFLALMGEIQNGREDDGIRFAVEIFRPEEVFSHDDRFFIEEHRPEDGLFRFYALRRDAVHRHEAGVFSFFVFSSLFIRRHGLSLLWGPCSRPGLLR